MKLLNQPKSVQLWHHKIGNHKVAPQCLKDFQRDGSIARFDNLVTLLA